MKSVLTVLSSAYRNVVNNQQNLIRQASDHSQCVINIDTVTDSECDKLTKLSKNTWNTFDIVIELKEQNLISPFGSTMQMNIEQDEAKQYLTLMSLIIQNDFELFQLCQNHTDIQPYWIIILNHVPILDINLNASDITYYINLIAFR